MKQPPALVIAAHGTRDANGVEDSWELVNQVKNLLPGVEVTIGFVELVSPPIDQALSEVLSKMPDPQAVVVPLMIGTGGHVKNDIPEAIEAGLTNFPSAKVSYSSFLGPDPRLVQRLLAQIAQAKGDWDPADTTVVLVGRGTLSPEANADHCRLARMVKELGNYHMVEPCFIQVTDPDLPTALSRVRALGANKIVVAPNYLFHGLLRKWVHEQTSTWNEKYPEISTKISEIIGPCKALAEVVVDRYRACVPNGAPVYLSGLKLNDQKVTIVGGGKVATRRIAALLAAGAKISLVSPEITESIAKLVDSGLIDWQNKEFEDADLDNARYVLALTNDPDVNFQVVVGADRRNLFVVRADDAAAGSAFTPATARLQGLTIAVVGDRNPKHSIMIRDRIVKALQ